ncbi:temptin-like [Mytilus californianus]|uniref:temptin-like n=1 Tax=Mytilus californianus TaxID=6549 RepID=UPI00224778B7|nr:temptin-like [Mytilus californianus]
MRQILISVFLISLTYGYPWFQGKIPNGNKVPDPSNFRWTVNICEMDSDGDGKTNGEELGDPKCEWYMEATNPVISNATGHPGICEPMSSLKCRDKNVGIYCDSVSGKFGR